MDNKNSNNKRGADDPNQDNNNNKRSRSAKVDLRFLVASRDAGAIIGRGGKNIQQLRTKHKTIIQVPDCDGPERILTIGGEIDACIDCLTDVLPTMADNQRLRQDQNELRALIHQSQAGAIIGKGGERVKELRQKHGLDVKVFPETCPQSTDRVVLCRGEQDAILNCLREVYSILDKTPPRGPVRLYDPFTYDEFLIQGYGGFANDETSQYPERRQRGGQDDRQGGGGGNYNDRQGGYNRGGGDYYPQQGPMPNGMRPMMDQYGQPPPQTTQVTIPNDLVGAIIGPRGTRISQIRQQSGAGIKIDDPLPDSNDRVITIQGSPLQTSQAQYLLQMAVKQSGLYSA